MSFPGNLHQDGYQVGREDSDGAVRFWVSFYLEGQEVERMPLFETPTHSAVAPLAPAIEAIYGAIARYFRLLNRAQLSEEEEDASVDQVFDGITQLLLFCRERHPFEVADWTYVTSRAPDDHLYKHKTENRFLRVVENQWTEELTAEEVERMLAQDQASDSAGW